MPLNDVSTSGSSRRILRIFRNIFLRTLLVVLLLVILIIALIQFPAVQNYIKNKVVSSLSEKLNTTVKLGYIRINFGGSLVINDLYIADRQQDTVIAASKIRVTINPAGLFRKKVIVSNVLLSGTGFNYMVLDSAGKSNIDFIIHSFAGDKNETKAQPGKPWDIQIKRIRIEQTRFAYSNLSDSLNFNLSIGRVLVNVSGNNLDSLSFAVDRIQIQNTRVNIVAYNRAERPLILVKKEKEDEKASGPLSVSLKRLDLKEVIFHQADSLSGSEGTYRIGEGHIIPQNIDLAKQKIHIASLVIHGGFINLDGGTYPGADQPSSPKTGTTAESSWQINLDKGNIRLDKIRLNQLISAGEGSINYLSEISLSNFVMDVSATFSNSKSWNLNLRNLHFEDDRTLRMVSLTVDANGEGNRIKVSPFSFRLGRSYITGTADGLFSGEKEGGIPDLNASISSSNLLIADFEPYLPKSVYPGLKRIPSQMRLTAELHSFNQVLHGSGELLSDQGDIRFKAEMNQGASRAYTADISMNEMNAGFFIQNQQLGRVNAVFKATGNGFKPDSMQSVFSLVIPSVVYKGITYNNLQLDGKVNNGNLSANLISGDPIAKMVTSITGTLNEEPEFRINAHIQNLDLHAMKLIQDTVAFSGIIDASYKSAGEGQFRTQTDTLLLDIRLPGKEIETNTRLAYSVLGDSVDARIKSNFGEVAYSGNIPLQEITTVMKNYFRQYFSAEKSDSAQSSDKFFRLRVDVNDLTVLKDFTGINIDVPEDAKISAELKDNVLNSNVDIRKIIYQNIQVDDLALSASGKDSSFRVDFKTSALFTSFQTFKDISLTGNLFRGNLETRLEISNADSRKWFNIGVTMQPQNPELNLVVQEPLMLNHQQWEVDENNRTYIRNKNVVFDQVTLTNADKIISLISDARQPEKLAVSFKNLDLKLFSELLNNDTTYLSGKINGDLMATYLFARPLPVFDAKLNITNIILENNPLGELNIAASNTGDNDIAQINVKFGQQNMSLNLDGTYGLTKDIPMNLNLNMKNLELAAIQPLIKEILTDASGAVNASVNVRGTFATPEVNGEIGFSKASAFIEPIQAKFGIDNQRLVFRNNSVDLNNFTIKDADGSPVTISGRIDLASLRNYRYNLNIKSDKFLAYQGPPDNLPGQDNKIILTSDIKVTGDNKAPQVNANLGINEGSRFFYKITKGPSTLTEEGIIEFKGINEPEQEEEPETSLIKNMSLTANLSVANNTAVTIITDPVRNFGLNMKAGGSFTLDQRPFQAPRLTGTLEISGGDYTMNLSGIKRKFQIADSSFIEWFGKISEPELTLRAYYEVRTSPAELLGDPEITSTLPFMVNMLISGSLENPEFKFRLSLPAEYEGVYDGLVAARLQEINSNESELNQNAMTLLLFGSFGFNNFANLFSSGGGANVLISNALNQFAAQKIKFVELHFDLQSYDNYGGATQDNLRTEMKIAASRKFDNERLNVQLGATVVLQADELEQKTSIAERISPEFNINYLLNRPRTLSVRAFRRSEYRGLVEGKVISTGAGIMFQKDFNRFSQLFGKKPEESSGSVAEKQKNIDETQ